MYMSETQKNCYGEPREVTLLPNQPKNATCKQSFPATKQSSVDFSLGLSLMHHKQFLCFSKQNFKISHVEVVSTHIWGGKGCNFHIIVNSEIFAISMQKFVI